MTLGSGKLVWFDAPWLTPIDMTDFEVPLQNICRYNGAVDWRLVKHLVLGALLAELHYPNHPELQMIKAYFCAHDLHEVVVGDMVAGMKRFHPTYQTMEDAWERYVHERVGLPFDNNPDKAITKTLDLRSLAVEMNELEHPAAWRVYTRFGGPITKEEARIFLRVQSMTTAECWEYVRTTIEEVQ